MKAVAQKVIGTPWFAVSLLIAGLVIGYSFVLLQNSEVYAEGKTCPHCEGEDCPYKKGDQEGDS